MKPKNKVALGAAAVVFFAAHGHVPAAGSAAPAGAQAATADAAIAWARNQIGKPYAFGATGPGAYDCSGLTMGAYASAGVSIPRTSQEQFAAGPQVSAPQRGDLVFFSGADGSPSSPGHVGIVTGPHAMIDAYGPDGAPISRDTFGLSSSRPGLTDPVGFTAPWEDS